MRAFSSIFKSEARSLNEEIFAKNKLITDDIHCIYNEFYFNDLICLERKRSERSKKQFLVMLVNISNALVNGNKANLIRCIIESLFKCTREIDIKGWNKYASIIGVLFTEIGEGSNIISKDVIFNKVYAAFCERLDKDVVEHIVISFFLYPEENHKQPPAEPPNESLYPDLMKKSSPKNLSTIAKRALDLAGSLACLLAFSPFFLAFSVLIKLSSKGPVFFRQERIGQFGRKFMCLKFRSMYVNNDPSIHREFVQNLIAGNVDLGNHACGDGKAAPYKIQKDPRITPIGGFLRKTSLDELPQFLNVLKGDMSLVGPRPPIEYEVVCYDIWHRRRVLEVKPGITGLWQVTGRSSTTFDDMVRLDLKYVREWSIWLDIKLLIKTPWVVLTGKGGY